MWAQQEQRSPSRIVSGAGSLKSPGKFEEPGQEGWDRFFSKAASKDPLMRQGGDALAESQLNPLRNSPSTNHDRFFLNTQASTHLNPNLQELPIQSICTNTSPLPCPQHE
jgi:hypothetical protein